VVDNRSRYGPFSQWWFYVIYVSDRVYDNLRPDGVTRGKWRILNGKVASGLMSDSELQGGSPRLCRLRTASVVPCCNKH
jgi:hypothetical protein